MGPLTSDVDAEVNRHGEGVKPGKKPGMQGKEGRENIVERTVVGDAGRDHDQRQLGAHHFIERAHEAPEIKRVAGKRDRASSKFHSSGNWS